MNPNINYSDAVLKVKALWPIVKSLILGIGINMAIAVIAYLLIPDTAVMTKQELEEQVQLSQQELLIRKSAAIGMALALKKSITVTANAFTTIFKVPGLESKLRATSQMLASAPAFWMSYKILYHRLTTGEASLNIREIVNGGVPKGALAGAIFTGGVIHGRLSASTPV